MCAKFKCGKKLDENCKDCPDCNKAVEENEQDLKNNNIGFWFLVASIILYLPGLGVSIYVTKFLLDYHFMNIFLGSLEKVLGWLIMCMSSVPAIPIFITSIITINMSNRCVKHRGRIFGLIFLVLSSLFILYGIYSYAKVLFHW